MPSSFLPLLLLSNLILILSSVFFISGIVVSLWKFDLGISMSLLNYLNIWNTGIIINSVSLLVTNSVPVLGQFQFIDSSYYRSCISVFFLCLVIFDWMPDIVNFTLLSARYFCIYLSLFELCSGVQ